jgi:molecular chaperone HtpG
MTATKGSIKVHTENIFPIIKKFLYSDHEIFLRELVSNAVDATNKLRTLASIGEFKGELGDLTIEIEANSAKKTLTIRDKGVGMTAEEIDKYINQIAFSGAEEFVEKYKKAGEANMIGHFGMGFYSAFMVSKKVEIKTKSYKEDTVGARWICDGSTEYSIEEHKKLENRGTEIVLHIDAESEEFLEDHRINAILKKYCRFLPVPIKFGKKTDWFDDPSGEKDKDGNVKRISKEVDALVNNPNPLWKKNPTELKDQDYLDFYQELYPFTEPPLFWIHLNVDYPFNLTGILYFPKVKNELELQRNKIQLYCNQVFVTDEVKDIVPEFLMLLHGVIDSPDIPLNVSRSYLQSDANVKKITSHITKKVSDKLEEIFKNDRPSFEQKWESVGLFAKYGAVSDEKFGERAKKFLLLNNIDGKYFTIDEYKEFSEANQQDKDKNLVWLYTNDAVKQSTFINTAKKRSYDVLNMNGVLDNHFIGFLEQQVNNLRILRVDADAIDKLIDKGEKRESVLSQEVMEKLKTQVLEQVQAGYNTEVQAEALSPDDPFMNIIMPEWERRMKEMSQMAGGMQAMFMNQQERQVIVLNSNHPLASKAAQADDAVAKDILSQAYDLALLSQNMLSGDKLTHFIGRMEKLMLG